MHTTLSVPITLALLVSACGPHPIQPDAGPPDPTEDAGDLLIDAGPGEPPDEDAGPPDPPPEPDCRQPTTGEAVVYAHGVVVPEEGGLATPMLAVVDPVALEVTEWVELDCEWSWEGIESAGMRDGFLDLAVSADGRIVLAGANAFFELDIETHECTLIRGPRVVEDPTDPFGWRFHSVGTPNNLTFVPVGVLDPHREVMAGLGYRYLDQDDPRDLIEAGFLQYDPDDAAASVVYDWPEDVGLGISGDLVVVVDPCTDQPRSFVTMTGSEHDHCRACRDGEVLGTDCGDCLFEFDVRTGGHIREVALLPDTGVFGLALWGDVVLGFSAGNVFERRSGKVIAISPGEGSGAVSEVALALPEGFASVHWMGAGSTTRAPIVW